MYSKTCLKRPLSKRPKLVFKTNYHLMQVKSIAECSKGSILQYFRPSLSYHLSLRYLYGLFLSGRLRPVLMYYSPHVRMYFQSGCKTEDLISWLYQKPAVLDLPCFPTKIIWIQLDNDIDPTEKVLSYAMCLGQWSSRERSGSVVECLTQDWGATGSSLTIVTMLCP